MKHLSFLAFFFLSTHCFGQAFITTWKTNNPGTSCNSCLTIPTAGTGYNYDVDWDNDGIYDEFGISGNVTHDFGVPGTYTIGITGDFPRIFFYIHGDRYKILNINQWGNIAWTSMYRAFHGAVYLTSTAVDTPDLSNVTTTKEMFLKCHNFNGDLSSWNVGNIKNMNEMFSEATQFNSDISNWDVSQVTKMAGMFKQAQQFNSDLSTWDVAKVKDMSFMFNNSSNFNSDISNWDVQKVNNMHSMFAGTHEFNSDISNWNVSSVTNMESMFNYASKFDSDISNWDVSSVTNMSEMFRGANNFSGSIKLWDVSSVTNMSNMFEQLTKPNLDISGWDVSNVTNMSGMFSDFSSPNLDISNWDVGSVTDMSGMFARTSVLNGYINNWDVSNVTNMSFMFLGNTNFNLNISNWDVNSVTEMNQMFDGASNFNSDISSWDVSNVAYMGHMFRDANNFNSNISNWNVSNVVEFSKMFWGASNFSQSLGNWNISQSAVINDMLLNSGLSVQSYDNTIIGWNNLGITSKNLGAVNNLKYCNGLAARASLLNKGWTFSGDTKECPPCVLDLSGVNALVLDSTQTAITWDKNPDAGFFKIQYRIKGNPAWTLQNVKNTDFQRTFYTLKNLNKNTTYEYRVREQCPNLNVGPYSAIQEFTTYSSVATCGIPSKSAIGFTSDATKVVFLVNYEPNATKYNVRWRIKGTSGPLDSKVTTKSRTALTGLTPATDYEYRYRALCGGIWTGYSAWKDFTTNALPPAAPREENVNAELNTSDLQVFPNPTGDYLNISTETARTMRIQLMDLSGRVLVNRELADTFETVDMTSFAAGAYMLRVIFENGAIRSQKVLKL